MKYFLIALFGVLNVLDFTSTTKALKMGLTEMNPIVKVLAHNTILFASFKVLLFAFVALGLILMPMRLSIFIGLIACASFTWVVYHNYKLIKG